MERVWGEISIEQLSERLELFVYGEEFFFAHSSISPAEKIRLYRAQAVKLVLDRCIAYAPQGHMGSEKRVCKRDGGRRK